MKSFHFPRYVHFARDNPNTFVALGTALFLATSLGFYFGASSGAAGMAFLLFFVGGVARVWEIYISSLAWYKAVSRMHLMAKRLDLGLGDARTRPSRVTDWKIVAWSLNVLRCGRWGKSTHETLVRGDSSPHCVILVHGANRTENYQQRWAKYIDLFRSYGSIQLIGFHWSGNSTSASVTLAALQLTRLCRQLHRRNPDQKILLIGYSHGGTIALQCARHKKLGCQVRVITIATPPVRFDQESKPNVRECVPASRFSYFQPIAGFVLIAGGLAYFVAYLERSSCQLISWNLHIPSVVGQTAYWLQIYPGQLAGCFFASKWWEPLIALLLMFAGFATLFSRTLFHREAKFNENRNRRRRRQLDRIRMLSQEGKCRIGFAISVPRDEVEVRVKQAIRNGRYDPVRLGKVKRLAFRMLRLCSSIADFRRSRRAGSRLVQLTLFLFSIVTIVWYVAIGILAITLDLHALGVLVSTLMAFVVVLAASSSLQELTAKRIREATLLECKEIAFNLLNASEWMTVQAGSIFDHYPFLGSTNVAKTFYRSKELAYLRIPTANTVAPTMLMRRHGMVPFMPEVFRVVKAIVESEIQGDAALAGCLSTEINRG